ncbi:MAG: hypothetical protein AAFW00_19690 [Bacteroidota bacterium]
MPRNMSFAQTIPQVRNRTKTVTRRVGWKFLQPGTIICAVEKAQGIKKGELKRICMIEITKVSFEPLWKIGGEHNGCAKEGFPDMTPFQFVKFFAETFKVDPSDTITRIEFEYVDDPN